MWRAMVELTGAGKDSMLFEEAFAMRLVRLFQRPVEEHPFILASKSGAPRALRPAFRATISVAALAEQARPAESLMATVTVTNTGSAIWYARAGSGANHVRIGVQLLDAAARVIGRDFARADLEQDVAPAESQTVPARFNAPPEVGDYRVKFDLVVEGMTWFEPAGTSVEIRPLRVLP
jgi:hypothetical protein